MQEIRVSMGQVGHRREEMLRMETAQSSRDTSLMTGRDIDLEKDRHFSE